MDDVVSFKGDLGPSSAMLRCSSRGHRVVRVTGRRFDGERAQVMRDVGLFLTTS